MEERYTAMDTGGQRVALFHGLPVAALVLALFYYWFAVANRYVVFLYYHAMGPLVPDTSPFSAVTSSRYWMAGLVAGGFVLVLYSAASWLVGRLHRSYRPPSWWQVWVFSAGPILIGCPLITMTMNEPRLPAANAATTTFVTLIGVGLALAPGRIAARRSAQFVLLGLDGWAVAAAIFGVAMLERAVWMLGRGYVWALLTVGLGLAGSVLLILGLTALRVWRRTASSTALEVFVAGLCVAYLLLPLLHHVAFTDGYYYISDADNFFSRSWGLQLLAWVLAAALAGGVARLRRALAWEAPAAGGAGAPYRAGEPQP